MNNTKKSGFTLIELLVVVAIIGILASLVIASLNQARSRGVDAAIKGTMSSMRAEAEIAYDGANSYTGICAGALLLLIDDVEKKNNPATLVCQAAGQRWHAASALTTDPSKSFCVDHTGFAGQVSTGAEFNVDGTCKPAP